MFVAMRRGIVAKLNTVLYVETKVLFPSLATLEVFCLYSYIIIYLSFDLPLVDQTMPLSSFYLI